MTTTYSQQIGLSAYLLPVLTYDNVPDAAQSILWSILRYDSNIGGGTASQRNVNVLDKFPEEITKGTGYPWLIVPAPSISEQFATYRKKDITLEYRCEMYTRQTKVDRQMLGYIRSAVRRNLAFFGKFRMELARVDSESEPYQLDDGNMAYKAEIVIQFLAQIDYVSGT